MNHSETNEGHAREQERHDSHEEHHEEHQGYHPEHGGGHGKHEEDRRQQILKELREREGISQSQKAESISLSTQIAKEKIAGSIKHAKDEVIRLSGEATQIKEELEEIAEELERLKKIEKSPDWDLFEIAKNITQNYNRQKELKIKLVEIEESKKEEGAHLEELEKVEKEFSKSEKSINTLLSKGEVEGAEKEIESALEKAEAHMGHGHGDHGGGHGHGHEEQGFFKKLYSSMKYAPLMVGAGAFGALTWYLGIIWGTLWKGGGGKKGGGGGHGGGGHGGGHGGGGHH